MQLIPAIDLRLGEVVRLAQGDDARRTSYGRDPLEVLRDFALAGIERVHVVDLDAAFGETPQRALVAELAAFDSHLHIELGGGLRRREDLEWALEAGCERLVLGSLVAREPDRFASLVETFPQRLVPAVEVAAGAVRIAGWRETSPLPLGELCDRLRDLPCPAVLVTDVERDGTLEGPNLDLARDVARRTELPALLSGGVHSLSDLQRAAKVPELAGVIVGKALYEGVFSLEHALAAVGDGAAG